MGVFGFVLIIGIFSFVGSFDSNDISYSDTWNLQSNLVRESASASPSSGGYMGNVGSGQTGSYTLEEALELQKRRIESAEANPASGSGIPYQNTNDNTRIDIIQKSDKCDGGYIQIKVEDDVTNIKCGRSLHYQFKTYLPQLAARSPVP